MVNTKEIFNNLTITYMGVELNKISVLRNYGEYLCSIFDAEDKHKTTLSLNTGSLYYHAMTVAMASLACLFYSNSDNGELIASLKEGDMLIVDGQRVRFKGIKDGSLLGIGFIKGVSYFAIECNNGNRWLPLSKAKDLNISIYQGDSDTLGGKGIRTDLTMRKEFLSCFLGTKDKNVVSTEIITSLAIISDRAIAESLYRNISFKYKGKSFPLSNLVTAAYYSDNDCYQIGNNPTKEEPILKFYSKVSACRDDILSDRKRRIIGCIIADEDIWGSNSEIHDLTDRRGLKFVVLEGRTHYTKYCEWLSSDDYFCYAIVPEKMPALLNEEEFAFSTKDFRTELYDFSVSNISDMLLESGIELKEYLETKRKILKIKKEAINNEVKEDFLITTYFLLNLCRSTFFPLVYCDKAYEKKLLSWSIKEKIQELNKYSMFVSGDLYNDVNFVIKKIVEQIETLYNCNPKGEIIKERITNKKLDSIVVTKAYYDVLFSLWLDDCRVPENIRPNVITVSAFERSLNCFDKTAFITGYYDFLFNPYATFGFRKAEVLQYDFEQVQCALLKKRASAGKKLLKEKNYLSYEINEEVVENIIYQQEDEDFETEMDKLAKELQLKGAYKYLSSSNNGNDGMIKVAKILTFASGNTGFFTKHYKGYRINGTEIAEVDLENLNVGDSIVFTKQTENKDIVDLLVNQLIANQYKETAYPEYYRLSVSWKEALRKHIKENGYTYQEVADKLRIYGCEKHQVTIRAWLCEEAHIVGPREEKDYDAIIKLVGLSESSEAIKKACDEIRSLRMKILDLLGKSIIKGIFNDRKDDLWDAISSKAENLSQIEQITSINKPAENACVPMYMINKPCDI